MLNEFENAHSFSGRIQNLLLREIADGRFPDIEGISLTFGYSIRTLRRKLKSEGMTFQHIKDQVRKDLAITYLEDSNLTIQKIGEMLGFSEATNFRKAFTRWTGYTPIAFRLRRRSV